MTTLLPALLVIFGRWAFWPRIPRYGEPQPDDSRWGRIGDRVARRPRLVWVGSTLALGALAFGLLGVKTGLDSEHFTTTTPDSVVGQRLMAQHYPAGRDEPTQVIVAASSAAQAGATARTVPGVAETQPPELSTDGRLAEIGVVLDDQKDSQAAGATVDRLRAALPETAVVGGSTATWLDRDRAQSHDRRVVIPLVLAVVLAVLMLLLRALVAPLLLIATVVLSYLAAFGGSWLLFQHVFGFPAVEAQIALMAFLFLVALGVDYNIFLVSQIREEVLRVGHADGVRRGLAATGGVISAAGLVLAATFGALMVLPLTMMVEMGAMVAFGVLLDTFLVRSVVVPALALDVGRRFWWPGRLARASAGERENRERALDIARR
jgi:putative drug exporter of the RND superfamily